MSVQEPALEELLDRGWRNDDVLRELHQGRGWSAADIARRFDVDRNDVLAELKDREIFVGGSTHTPKNGLARELWVRGTTPDAGGDGSLDA
jgi:hypothetical protein